MGLTSVTSYKAALYGANLLFPPCSELDSIDSKVFPTIYQDFCESINSLKTKTYSSKKANFSRLELEEFYSQVVFQHLHKVGQDLQLNAVQYLQKSLSEDMSRASPKNLIKFLRDLIKFLVARRSNFEEQRISKLAFEESASRALINLYDLSLDREKVWNAITIIFQSKFDKDVYSICSRIYLNLIDLCQSYCQLSERSLIMLEKIESSIRTKCSINLTSVPVFTLMNRIDIVQQRSLIEFWIGHCINYWGNSPVSWQQLEAKILQNIEHPAQKLYFDFQACFLENISVSQDLDQERITMCASANSEKKND